jgi:hypothetical protein
LKAKGQFGNGTEMKYEYDPPGRNLRTEGKELCKERIGRVKYLLFLERDTIYH